MNESIINLFGTYLSELIQKPTSACKGFIRFEIRKFLNLYDASDDQSISYEDFHYIVQNSMKQDLINANILNVNEVLEKLTNEITLQKVIFSMSI